ncbi:MAG TPA: aminoacyl-tRNA hydrolase [Candidatus Acidoferrales bacterium]
MTRPKLIVGLGNPGPEYAWTPHNLGFFVVDLLAERAGARIERPEAKSLIGKARLADTEVVLAKPQTYMNLSGMAVRDLAERLEAAPPEILVVFDDVALPWGMIRIRERGSEGGHNGLRSILSALGTLEVPRVRLGIQPDHPVDDLAAYVTRPMRKADLEQAAEMVECAAGAVEMILRDGLARAMNQYNRKAATPEPPTEEK